MAQYLIWAVKPPHLVSESLLEKPGKGPLLSQGESWLISAKHSPNPKLLSSGYPFFVGNLQQTASVLVGRWIPPLLGGLEATLV